MSAFSRTLSRENPGRFRLDALDDGYPTSAMLLANNPPNLTQNKLWGSYQDVCEYINVHVDLLLEDFIFPLRSSIQKFKQSKNRNSLSLNGARVYHNVTLKSIKVRREVTCVMDLSQSKGNENQPPFGSLLVFTRRGDFNEDLFLATVISDSSKTSEAIELKLKFPGESRVNYEGLCEGDFIVIEGEAFFYVYFHVLKALNTLNETNFPMKRYIVYGKTPVGPPAYLRSSTMYTIFDHDVQVLNSYDWPSAKALQIDNEAQYTALKKALTEEIALIQGPPGTGKTYFGVLLVKTLLTNEFVWNPKGSTPLIIICQSNDALDHFLEKLLSFTNKIVRIGDQCQSEALKKLSLKRLVCKKVTEKHDFPGLHTHRKNLSQVKEQIFQLTLGIVSLKTLQKYGIISHQTVSLFKCEQNYLKWLGMNVKVKSEWLSNSDTDLIISKAKLVHLIYKEYSEDSVLLLKDEASLRKIIRDFCGSCRQKISYDLDSIPLLSSHDAQQVYLSWLDDYYALLNEKLKCLEDGLETFWGVIPGRLRHIKTIEVLKCAQVVGMTSTGAASRRHILEDLKAPIVIIEEAGELLESHVIVSMTEHCQHLIMMGDHKQLKPGVTTDHLAKNYNLNVSLFERLLTNQVTTGTCLTTQYRMKPEISALLKPHIYSILRDGPGTMGRPRVRGISKSVFFLDHRKMEQKALNNKGCWNPYEVDMLINLAKYLVSRGYSPFKITIIAMYGEQKNKLVEARNEHPTLTDLQIASVDSFQGKENEIILLSLVRSNNNGNIGFLKEENRVCVALSRARDGLYIVGNMNCLTRGSNMWMHVSQRLQQQDAIGPKLTLVCETHKTVIRHVRENEDWITQYCRRCAIENELSAIEQERIAFENYFKHQSLPKQNVEVQIFAQTENSGLWTIFCKLMSAVFWTLFILIISYLIKTKYSSNE